MTSQMIYTVILRNPKQPEYTATHVHLPQGVWRARNAAEQRFSGAEVVAIIPGNHPTDLMPTRSS